MSLSGGGPRPERTGGGDTLTHNIPPYNRHACNGHNKHAPLLNCHKFAPSHFRDFPHQISQCLFTLPELARRCYFRAANSNQGTAISSLFEAVHRPNGRTSRGHKPSNTCLHLIQPSQPGQGRPGAKHYYVPGLASLVVQQPLPPITKCQVPTVDDIVCNRCLLSCLVHIWPQQKWDQAANVAGPSANCKPFLAALSCIFA